MKQIIVEADSKSEAKRVCRKKYGWTPDAVRKVDSGSENVSAYLCFESQVAAERWDKQT